MSSSIWDRETILDITVNVIPLGILLFFTVAFVAVDQFGWDSLYTPLQLALVVVPFVGLVILTYFSAKAIETDADERPEDVEAIPGYKSRAATPAVEGETGGRSSHKSRPKSPNADGDRLEKPPDAAAESDAVAESDEAAAEEAASDDDAADEDDDDAVESA